MSVPVKADKVKKERREEEIKIEGKEKSKEPVPVLCGRTSFLAWAATLAIIGSSSSYPSDLLEDSMKRHKARREKGEETLAKLLKEGRDARGFAIKRKKVWRKRKECYELKREKNNGGQYTPSKASDSKEGAASRAD